MKLYEFINRKIVESKDNKEIHFHKTAKRWYLLLNFEVLKNYKMFAGYLNKCFQGRIIARLIDRPLEFDKVYAFGGKMKMKLWINSSSIIEPVVSALNAVMNGLDELSKDKNIYDEAILEVAKILNERFVPKLSEYNKRRS